MKMVVDKAGRTVIPKLLRDRLFLKPGAELNAYVEDGRLIAEPRGPEAVLVRDEHGRLVFTTNEPVTPMTQDELVDFIHELREQRMDDILRGSGAPEEWLERS